MNNLPLLASSWFCWFLQLPCRCHWQMKTVQMKKEIILITKIESKLSDLCNLSRTLAADLASLLSLSDELHWCFPGLQTHKQSFFMATPTESLPTPTVLAPGSLRTPWGDLNWSRRTRRWSWTKSGHYFSYNFQYFSSQLVPLVMCSPVMRHYSKCDRAHLAHPSKLYV